MGPERLQYEIERFLYEFLSLTPTAKMAYHRTIFLSDKYGSTLSFSQERLAEKAHCDRGWLGKQFKELHAAALIRMSSPKYKNLGNKTRKVYKNKNSPFYKQPKAGMPDYDMRYEKGTRRHLAYSYFVNTTDKALYEALGCKEIFDRLEGVKDFLVQIRKI